MCLTLFCIRYIIFVFNNIIWSFFSSELGVIGGLFYVLRGVLVGTCFVMLVGDTFGCVLLLGGGGFVVCVFVWLFFCLGVFVVGFFGLLLMFFLEGCVVVLFCLFFMLLVLRCLSKCDVCIIFFCY